MDRRLLGDDAALLGATHSLVGHLLVLLDHVHALDNDLVGRRVGRDDRAARALVLAGRDHHVVTLFDLHLEHLRRQRDDPHETLLPQLTAYRAEDASAARIPAVPDEDSGVLVEADVGTVCAAALLAGTHHDRLDDVALLDASPGQRVLDGRHDDVTDARVSPAAAAEHADAQNLLGTRVVGDLKPRLLLDHVNSCFVTPVFPPAIRYYYLARSRISATRHRLVAESGRVSISSTRSPTPHSFFSSCALYFLVRRMTLPYLGCFTRSSTATTTVLSILSLTTRPARVFREPRCSAASSATVSAGLVLTSRSLRRPQSRPRRR